MNLISFKTEGDRILGFVLKGHCTADEDDEEGRLVCASVSSAAYMTANTITDVIEAPADITVGDSYMELDIRGKVDECQPVLKGFSLHLNGLAEQYKSHIQINSEV